MRGRVQGSVSALRGMLWSLRGYDFQLLLEPKCAVESQRAEHYSHTCRKQNWLSLTKVFAFIIGMVP